MLDAGTKERIKGSVMTIHQKGNKDLMEALLMAETSNKPLHNYRSGGLNVSVWKNVQKGKDGKEYDSISVQVQNRYKDGDDWKDSKSIRMSMVPKVIVLLQKAFEEHTLKAKEEDD